METNNNYGPVIETEGELKHSDYISHPRINYEHLSRVLEVKHRIDGMIPTMYLTRFLKYTPGHDDCY